MNDDQAPKAQPAGIRATVITGTVQKAETTVNTSNENASGVEWISQPAIIRKLKGIVEESTILPQCIRAYRNNIAGFGFGIRYKDDFSETEETEAMKAEWNTLQSVLDLLTIEQDSKELFQNVVEGRETYGISYLEVVRNTQGLVVQADCIKDIPSIQMTAQMGDYVEQEYFYSGERITRKKRFRRYRQTIGGHTVYFKEFGDPRIMDYRTGAYVSGLEAKYRANEIMAFPIGSEPYGEVRWIGQLLTVDGCRRAEVLNNNYFINGRHTPLLIAVKGGTLSDESFDKLRGYMDDIKGINGQHAFIVLETEPADNRTSFTEQKQPEIEIKDLASILQKDELFQDYLANGRSKVQSSFLLPDLYTGYTHDFNRATALAAQEVTEEQVFQPERKSLAWIINNKLLNCYKLQYCEVFFREPDITNPDDVVKILTLGERLGSITPNKGKDYIGKFFGETPEDFDEAWGDVPLEVARVHSSLALTSQAAPTGFASPNMGNYTQPENGADGGAQGGTGQSEAIDAQLDMQIQKAAAFRDSELVPVLKEIRRLLISMEEQNEATP